MTNVIAQSGENDSLRRKFFERAFGDSQGFIGVAYKTKAGTFREAYFAYPTDIEKLLEWINTNVSDRDLYFCPQLLEVPRRVKTNVSICPTLWADLDEVDLKKIDPPPSILITTSYGRYQALWVLKEPGEPIPSEDASRRLAYANKADVSGWDLTQLLRIPLTYNNKYEEPQIILAKLTSRTYSLEDFDKFEEAPQYSAYEEEFPEADIEGLDPERILERNRRRLLPNVFTLYHQAPSEKDWSSALWALECILAEAGLTKEEIFVVARASAVNKYRRDKRPPIDLWREVIRAKASVDMRKAEDVPPVDLGPLLTDAEHQLLNELEPTFIDRYIEWGKARSDAAWQYHQAGALVILSTLLADRVKLETSFGSVIPNLWFMLLGDTTLTRKTTAMEMAIDLLLDISEDAILATDGSIEGILSALGQREAKSSLFWRDEFSGMLESMRKRDYYTGMVEALTKLYDGKYLKRVLRKETIEIRNPIFMMFCGGIKSRILELLNTQYILSGFVPRFVYITAEADLEGFRPIGPALNSHGSEPSPLVDELGKIKYDYTGKSSTTIGKQTLLTGKVYDAELKTEAWKRYNTLERTLVQSGINSEAPDLYTPTMDRLSKSALKAAVLIAASRQQPPVVVEEEDMLRAIALAESWVPHSISVIANAGKSTSERSLERALNFIRNGKDTRGALMRAMHLTSRDTDMLLDTLEQRGVIVRTKYRKSEKLFPTTTEA